MIKFLNKQTPFLETYGRKNHRVRWFPMHQPPSGLAALQDSFLLDGRVWYCNFTTENSFKIFDIKDLMGPKTYDKVIKKTATIVLDLSFEPFLKSIDSIYEDIIIKLKIPSSQVIFLSNMYDANIYNISAAKKYNQSPIRIFYFSALEYMARNFSNSMTSNNTLTLKKYDKAFLNLNRRWRLHRPLLILLLRHRGLLDNGFVSFAECEGYSWKQTWTRLVNSAAENSEISNIIMKNTDIKSMPPLYLDTNDLNINRPELEHSTKIYYENSYFSVISETTFYYKEKEENSRFITEKTFKAIFMKHPFILVSIPKSLEVLRELGYKTFSPWINESYDLEEDDNTRMLMLVDEIERLTNLSSQELEEFLIAMKEICLYNYNILRDKKEFVYER